MGQVFVNGLGVVNIAGDTPTPEEQRAIINAVAQQRAPAGAEIPAPIVPEQLQGDEPARPINELGDIASRGTFEAAGGMLGAFAGGGAGAAAAAPTVAGIPPAAIAGSLAGGALGTAAGSAVFDNLNNFGKAIGVFTGEPVGGQEVGTTAAISGAQDVPFGMAGFAIGPALDLLRGGKPLLGRILGVSDDEARQLSEAAARSRIDLGIGDVSKRAGVTGFPKVIGVIPVVGGPTRKQAAKQAAQVVSEGDRLINDLAPLGQLSDLGVDLSKAAEASFKGTKEKIGKVWDLFGKAVEKAGKQDIIPTGATKDFLTDALEEASEGAIGQAVPKLSMNNKLNKFLLGLQNTIPENVTLKQFRAIQKDLGQLADAAAKRKSAEDLRLIGETRRKLSADLQDIATEGLEEGVAQGIRSSLDLANKFTTSQLARFETATAGKLGRLVDRNMFNAGAFKAGSKTAEELGEVFANLPSAQAVREMRDVVGDELITKLAQQRAVKAFESAKRPVADTANRMFDPQAFETALGLNTPLKREALEEALKNSPVSINEIEDFIKVSKKVFDTKIGDPSSFAARRIALAIGGGGLGAGAAAAGLEGISSAAVLLAALGFGTSKFLSNPKRLRALTQLLEPSLLNAQKRGASFRTEADRNAAIGRVIEAIMKDRQREISEQTQTGP